MTSSGVAPAGTSTEGAPAVRSKGTISGGETQWDDATPKTTAVAADRVMRTMLTVQQYLGRSRGEREALPETRGIQAIATRSDLLRRSSMRGGAPLAASPTGERRRTRDRRRGARPLPNACLKPCVKLREA
jgi:hypothetical protein